LPGKDFIQGDRLEEIPILTKASFHKSFALLETELESSREDRQQVESPIVAVDGYGIAVPGFCFCMLGSSHEFFVIFRPNLEFPGSTSS
jgi:hypothetical protein